MKSEPDFAKRSELALLNADHAMDAARKGFSDGDSPAMQSALAEVSESVEVSFDALQHTHGEPRKNKYYKRAELQLNALSRRLTGLRDEVGFEARPAVEAAMKKVSDVHDEVFTSRLLP